MAQSHFNGQITDEEFVNAVFDPQEQVNGKQAELLGAVFTLAAGGPAEVHVGTGSGGAHRLTFRGVNEKTSKVIGKNKPKNLLWSRIGVIFRYSNNRMRFFSYLCVQNLTIQK